MCRARALVVSKLNKLLKIEVVYSYTNWVVWGELRTSRGALSEASSTREFSAERRTRLAPASLDKCDRRARTATVCKFYI